MLSPYMYTVHALYGTLISCVTVVTVCMTLPWLPVMIIELSAYTSVLLQEDEDEHDIPGHLSRLQV